jgi:single-strand DNA-binding protein
MKGINQVVILGNVGHQPEFKVLPSGKAVCTFSIAVNSRAGGSEATNSHTEWINIKTWDRQAEIAEQYVHAGDLVGIQGRMRTEKWTTADGEPRSKLYIYSHDLHLMPKRDGGGASASAPTDQSVPC